MPAKLPAAGKNPAFNTSEAHTRATLETRARATETSGVDEVPEQVYPDTGTSSEAMATLNSFINEISERAAAGAFYPPTTSNILNSFVNGTPGCTTANAAVHSANDNFERITAEALDHPTSISDTLNVLVNDVFERVITDTSVHPNSLVLNEAAAILGSFVNNSPGHTAANALTRPPASVSNTTNSLVNIFKCVTTNASVHPDKLVLNGAAAILGSFFSNSPGHTATNALVHPPTSISDTLNVLVNDVFERVITDTSVHPNSLVLNEAAAILGSFVNNSPGHTVANALICPPASISNISNSLINDTLECITTEVLRATTCWLPNSPTSPDFPVISAAFLVQCS